MKADLRSAIHNEVIAGDGAMGTFLYQMGFPVGISYEEMNLLKPEVISSVHAQYYAAGARIIETNTFSASREKLIKYGLEDQVEAINRAGVRIAKQAVGEDAYVVGAVGSIRSGRQKNIRTAQLLKDLRQQIEALLVENIDGLLFETFYDLDELLMALKITRSLSDLPVICQFATEGSGSTMDGHSLPDAFLAVQEAGADAAGFNCRSGPNGLLRSLEKVAAVGMPFSVFPNAGLPDYVDGRYMYAATPDYFAEFAVKSAALGARIVGGCCGTTPEHIKAVAHALKGLAGSSIRKASTQSQDADQPAKTMQTTRSTQASDSVAMASALDIESISAKKFKSMEQELSILEVVKRRHTVIVELDPPKDLNISRFMEGVALLEEVGADAITMADNSLAVTRMSNLALGYLIKDKFGSTPLIHIACRDRNLIGTQSHLMGLHALGIRHVLAVTGDPARFGDLPGSSSVYDLTSFEMIRMIKQLNEGIAFSGKPLKEKANFIVGAAFNPNVKYLDKAVQRLERKIEAGADYVMTQPVYDPVLIEKIYEYTQHLNIPIFLGIMPLASGGNAAYLHNEVPGIQLSKEVLQRMEGLKGEEGRKAGIQIAEELLDTALPRFKGIYFMTPFMYAEMTADLTRYVWRKTGLVRHRA